MYTDQELAALVAKGDQKAFGLLVERYGGLIKAIANYHLRATPYAEECVNDCLFAVWRNIGRWDSGKNTLKNWIGAVCKYKCLDYLRRHYRDGCLCELTEDIPAEEPEDVRRLAEELLEGLNPEDRRLFYDHYINGESVVDIAERTGDRPDRLYNRLSLGRKKLRNLYKEREQV